MKLDILFDNDTVVVSGVPGTGPGILDGGGPGTGPGTTGGPGTGPGVIDDGGPGTGPGVTALYIDLTPAHLIAPMMVEIVGSPVELQLLG
ncbi:hypothetical protein [Massilia endophytica]|uniref:hypothetical protein n=1 Tax=Massilia endophytica TaxID=2899220 RepID=UPI001E60BFC9|nr:hypothetical protein [Massilia endophytica]UGQ44570.1 hypothetical protein LSQ66_12185 [Massilia endophytica]